MLAIKPHKKGTQLKVSKKEIHNRRLFVRIVSKLPIKIDLKAHFSTYGPVESAYVIEDNQRFQDTSYTIIGYVLFYDKEPAAYLLNNNKFSSSPYEFSIKKIRDKSAAKPSNKNKKTLNTVILSSGDSSPVFEQALAPVINRIPPIIESDT